MGLVLAPFGGRGCGAVRGSAVPEVAAASGKQREIKARRARRQLRIGVCVRVGCVCVCLGICVLASMHTCSPDAYFCIARVVCVYPLVPPSQTEQFVSPSALATQGDPKTLLGSSCRASGEGDGEGCERCRSSGSE